MKLRLLCLFLCSLFMASSARANYLTVDGKTINFSAVKSKWIVLHYYADWCPSCVEDIKLFNHLYQSKEIKDFTLFAVNFDPLDKSALVQSVKEKNIRYPVLIGNPIADYGVDAVTVLPTTFYINTETHKVIAHYGPERKKVIIKLLAS